MSLQKKQTELKRIWCPGCGLFTVETVIAKEMENLGWNKNNTVVISGIGCTARISEYFNLDTIHVTHGRTIPTAEGIKIANPKLNVVVISGDGDLLSIGGNHLLHGSRRNTDIKIFCNNNRLYAMTGGQTAASTPKNMKTKTAPFGSNIEALNTKGILKSNKEFFFAKTNTLDLEHFKKSVKDSLQWKGFSFVEVLSPCASDIERKIRSDNMKDILGFFKKEKDKDTFEILHS